MELHHSIHLDAECYNVFNSGCIPIGKARIDLIAVVVPEIVHDFLPLCFVAKSREICNQLVDSSGLSSNLSILKVGNILQELSFLSIEISNERFYCGHVFFHLLNVFKQRVDLE